MRSGKKERFQLLPFLTDCSKVLMSQLNTFHNMASQFEVHGFVCELAEQNWAFPLH